MNAFNFNTEENFMQPSGRKNLDELFHVGINNTKGDESLRYTPPKAAAHNRAMMSNGNSSNNSKSSSDEHKKEGGDTTISPWQTIFAKIVNAFKDGENYGHVGTAILRNIDNAHRILVYKSKTNMLATLTIPQDLLRHRVYLHRQNCYWQFYDDVGNYWSLLFDRSTDETEFVVKLQENGFKIHLDVDVQPVKTLEVLVPASDVSKKLETENSEHASKSETVKHFPIQDTSTEEHQTSSDDRARKAVANSLLARLTKMGGQQLPRLHDGNYQQHSTQVSTERSDSELESTDRDHDSALTLVGHPMYSACTMSSQQPQQQQQQSQLMYATSTKLPKSTTSAIMERQNIVAEIAAGISTCSKNLIVKPAIEAQVMQMMLVENRTQNTEMRINIDKLDNKLEKVLERMEKLHVGGKQEDEILNLEEEILELKKENRRLRKEYRDVAERSDTSIDHVWRIYETELNNLGVNVTNNMYDMETLIGDLLDKMRSLKNQYHEKELQLKSALATAKEVHERYFLEKRSHNETIEKMEHMLQKLKSLQEIADTKARQEAELRNRLQKLNSKHATEITSVKVEMTQALKDIMNSLYHNLGKTILDMDRLVPEELLPLIGKIIREDTMAAVAKISK